MCGEKEANRVTDMAHVSEPGFFNRFRPYRYNTKFVRYIVLGLHLVLFGKLKAKVTSSNSEPVPRPIFNISTNWFFSDGKTQQRKPLIIPVRVFSGKRFGLRRSRS